MPGGDPFEYLSRIIHLEEKRRRVSDEGERPRYWINSTHEYAACPEARSAARDANTPPRIWKRGVPGKYQGRDAVDWIGPRATRAWRGNVYRPCCDPPRPTGDPPRDRTSSASATARTVHSRRSFGRRREHGAADPACAVPLCAHLEPPVAKPGPRTSFASRP